MTLEIRANPMTGRYRLSLCAIVHDEMYFLPAFFAHYRALGVERFVILDDASTDGTADFLSAQPDCMLLGSPVRFFEEIDGRRAVYAWRQELMDRFARDQWTVFADADEFLGPPAGIDLAAVIARLERQGSDAIWGVLLDIYPKTVAEVLDPTTLPFDPAGPWYFDGVRHLWCRPGAARPRALYRGARARLFAENGIAEPDRNGAQRMFARLGLAQLRKLNNVGKVPLMKWTATSRWDGAHRITPPPTSGDILAIAHFKFTVDLGRKIGYALATGGYEGGSRQYRLMAELLAAMRANNRDFLGRKSRRLSGYDLYATGVGRWSEEVPGA